MKTSRAVVCLRAAAGAGLVAGALAGAGETLLLAALGGNADNLHALLWATVAYGLLGLVGGVGLGLLATVLGPARRAPGDLAGKTRAFTWAATFSTLGLVLTRYRLIRDLFHEGIRTFSVQGLLLHGGLLGGFLILFFVLRWLWQQRLLRPVAGLSGAVAGYGLLLAAAGLASFLTRPANPHAPPPAGIPPGLETAPNILLIGVDTLRADRLSCYGYTASATPHIDGLAADGVLYAEMTAQASWTKPSFGTLFTSLYPSAHTATGKPHRLPEAVITLAEALAARGYHTGGLANNISIAPAFGFDQGFADYAYLEPAYFFGGNEAASQLALYQALRRAWAMASGGRIYVQNFYRDASAVNRAAIEWLDANKGTRFFLFVHYMDPHDPYFEHPYNGRGYARASNQNPDPALAPTFSALYDGEVRYLDEHLGALFDWLRAEGLYDGMLIVLTGDHGEEFQEHGGWWHGTTLYQEQIAVPLIIKFPGAAQPGTVNTELARSLDVAPTLLDAAGLAVPATMMGRSLWRMSEPPAYAFAEEDHEGNVLYAVRTLSHKLIRANEGNPRGLPPEVFFDLAADPDERHNLAPGEPDQVQSLRQMMREALTQGLERAATGETATLDAGIRDKLHDLGY